MSSRALQRFIRLLVTCVVIVLARPAPALTAPADQIVLVRPALAALGDADPVEASASRVVRGAPSGERPRTDPRAASEETPRLRTIQSTRSLVDRKYLRHCSLLC